MIKDVALWEAWEREYEKNHPLDFSQKLALLDGMYELARSLGVFPPTDPLEGIEVKIRMARILNHVPASSRTDRPES